MDLEQLTDEKRSILGQINAYEQLQLGLELIKKYNRENHTNDELKVYTMAYEPHLEEITECAVAEKIEQLTNNLLTVSEKINHIKMLAK
jgi:5'(3')-deoxyribonucleotidase